MHKNIVLAFSLLTISIVAAPVAAQSFQLLQPISPTALNNMTLSILANPIERRPSDRAVSQTYAETARGALNNLNYTPSSARRSANLTRFAEKARATDPVGAAKMRELFASTDIIAAIDQQMRDTYNMHATNVADAYALWWTMAWMGSQGRDDDVSAAQMQRTQSQAVRLLSGSSEFREATDATKQEFAEGLLVQAALIDASIDTYKSDPAMLARTRTAIAQGARAMGVDLNAMTLTDDGFVSVTR